jgi:DNA repair exonuclease SbcCD ATPase subunit
MRIKRIHAQGLTRHVDTEILFPEKGLVLITGDNGSGKSSLFEAIALCFWNKSLRGTKLWKDGTGEVTIETWDGLEVTRGSKGGRNRLTWDATDYQSGKKSQKDLNLVVGDFDVWRRSCVFTLGDVTTYASATNAQRQKMLENVLGVGKFDDAGERCLKRWREVELKVSQTKGDVRESDTEVALYKQAVASATQNLEDLRPEGDTSLLRRTLEAEEFALKEKQRLLADAQELHASCREVAAKHRAQIDTLTTEIRQLGKSVCPSCHRPFPEAGRAGKILALKGDLTGEELKLKAVEVQAQQARDEQTRHRSEGADLSRSIHEISHRLREHEQFEKKRGTLEAAVASSKTKLDLALDRQKDANVHLARGKKELGVLGAVRTVLGRSGLRANIVGNALHGFEMAANYWMERLAPGLSITLSPRRERSDGHGYVEELHIGVDGVGHSEGYRGISTGEQRRVDVPMTMAFGEVSAAANGQQEATMFMDEVDACVDPKGVAGLVNALNEVREQRCVVVISHSADMKKSLHPDIHYTVDKGVVQRVG